MTSSDNGAANTASHGASHQTRARLTAKVDVDPSVQRVVIVSDLHGYKEPLDALDLWLDQLSEPHLVFVNGDLFGGGIDGRFAVEWTMRRATGRTTRGNHDSTVFEYLKAEPSPGERAPDDSEFGAYRTMTSKQLDFVKSLPDILEVRWRGYSLRLMHGHFNLRTPARTNWRVPPAELSKLFADPAVDLTVIGHTHYPFVSRGAGGSLANPGSVAAPLFRYLSESGHEVDRRANDPNLPDNDSRPSFLSITEADGQLHPKIERFDYDRTTLLKRHATRSNLRMRLDVRRAWILEGRGP